MKKIFNDLYSQPISAKRFAVIDPEAETILAARKLHERCSIASITKLLTALVIVERGGLELCVEVRQQDITCPCRCADLRPGHAYSRRDLLSCMLINSANDAAQALARDCAGDVSAFAEMMNSKARELHMNSSLFCDPHGLMGEGQYSTVFDVAHLAMAADKNATIRSIVSRKQFELAHNNGEKTLFENTNLLLKTLSVCDGMKTGFTSDAKYCLVASGSLEGRRRIVIALGNEANIFLQDAHHLLAWGFGQATTEENTSPLQAWSTQTSVGCGFDAPSQDSGDFSPVQGGASIDEQPDLHNGTHNFEYFFEAYGKPAKEWACENIPKTSCKTVLYPFGGPDILFPLALFPQARNFFLVGKEPCTTPIFGTDNFSLQRLGRILRKRLHKIFPEAKERRLPLDLTLRSIEADSVTEALRHYYRASFFITIDLAANLKRHCLPGILPLLLAQLVQAGFPIHAVDKIERGSALRIQFGDRNAPSCLYYFSQDLSNDFFGPQIPIYTYLDKLESFITLIKSGSYMLPSPPFSQLSKFITNRGSLLVQDPTGIPYDELCKRNWEVTLCGRFFGDIPFFGERREHVVLRSAYQAQGVGKALPFGFGYLKNPAIASIVIARPRHAQHGTIDA